AESGHGQASDEAWLQRFDHFAGSVLHLERCQVKTETNSKEGRARDSKAHREKAHAHLKVGQEAEGEALANGGEAHGGEQEPQSGAHRDREQEKSRRHERKMPKANAEQDPWLSDSLCQITQSHPDPAAY